MLDTLNIGKYIYSTLSTALGKETKITPLIADNDTKFPFVVYKRIGLISNGCKDGYIEDTVTIEITVVTDKYKAGVDIANTIRKEIERLKTTSNGMDIQAILINAFEDYNGAFIQTMQFKLIIN